MASATGSRMHVCTTCGKTTTRKGHLCTPSKIEDASLAVCEFCGQTSSDPRHVCFPKRVELSCFCDDCGRLATTRSLLCKPRAIPKPKPKAKPKAKAKPKSASTKKKARPKAKKKR